MRPLLPENNSHELGEQTSATIGTKSQEQPPKTEGIPKDGPGAERTNRLESKNGMSVLYKGQYHYNNAEPLLLEAFKDQRLKLSDTHPYIRKL